MMSCIIYLFLLYVISDAIQSRTLLFHSLYGTTFVPIVTDKNLDPKITVLIPTYHETNCHIIFFVSKLS
jgi:cellulose synthase/poly-beta-1,6-N-acetylglucosamine synthase-like glycosyltransferase